MVLWPADYEPAYARLSIYRRIEVEVQVSPAGEVGPPLEPKDPFEEVYRGALVNYEQGRAWRRSAENRPGLRKVNPRSLDAVAMATFHPWFTSPSTSASGTNTSSRFPGERFRMMM